MTSLACLSTRRTLLALTALAAVACSFPDRTFDDNQFYSTQGGSGGSSGSSQGGRSGSSQGGAGTSPEGGGSDEVGGDAGSEQGGEAGTEAGGEAGSEQGGEAGTSAGDGGTSSGNAGKGGAAGTTAGTAGVSGSSGQGGAGQSGAAGASAGTAGTSAGTAGTAGKGGTAGTSGGSGQGGAAGSTAGTGGSAGTGPITCTSSADCPSPQLCNDIDFDKGTSKCNTGQATGAEIGQTCASNGDCKSLFCDISNTCAIFCASDAECGAGNVCASTPYFPTADANECLRSCKRNADCPANTGKLGGLCMALPNADKKSIAGACNYLGSDPPGSDGHSKTFGQAVVQGVDGCDTGLVYPVNSTPTCTRLCITNADCASPMPKCQQLQVQNSQLGITSTISACIP